jgi:hypothetical protein
MLLAAWVLFFRKDGLLMTMDGRRTIRAEPLTGAPEMKKPMLQAAWAFS